MRKMMVLAAAVAGSLAFAAPAAAEGGLCQLEGTADFGNTPLTTEAKDFTYSFRGDLLNCQSDATDPPTAGTVSAGNTRVIDNVTYQEPLATGHGSCGSSTTQGTSIIDWNDGTRTIVQYTTDGVTAAVGLQGQVIDSLTLTSLDGTQTTTLTSTRFPAGATSLGALVFDADGTQCAGEGVKTALIHGVTGVGDYA